MPCTVLVIDDDEDMIILMRKFLEGRGYGVIAAMDGNEGVRLALERRPDIITLDFNMPGENGREIFTKLRMSPETAVIPVIFLSATMTGLIERMVVKTPLVRFVKKPCRPAEMEKHLKEMLLLPRLSPPPAPPKKDDLPY